MNITKKVGTALILALTLSGALAGCTSIHEAPASAEKPSQPAKATPAPAAKPDNSVLKFGETKIWTNKVSLSVSEPTPFEPTQYAVGAVQASQVLFTMVLKNDSDKPLEPIAYAQVSSGGVEASPIFDSGNPAGDISATPTTVILPGQSVTWLAAYSITDPAKITLQVAPGFQYEKAIFTNIG